ncbi:MAG: hypothetical protein JSR39_00780 [Verrucomicrobia bacterium]|nr:hypothetical protein [Verrucomicrobiota bacterium]
MSMIAQVHSASLSPGESHSQADGFADAMHSYLQSSTFEKLAAYFRLNHPIYSRDPIWGKSFDLLLEKCLKKPEKTVEDWTRTLQVARLVEPSCPEWAKIAQAICCFELGDEAEGDALIATMIGSDAQQDASPSHLTELVRRQWRLGYASEAQIAGTFSNVLQRYDAGSQPPVPKSNAIPLHYIRA